MIVAAAVACGDGGAPDPASAASSITIAPRSVALLQRDSVRLTAIVLNRAGDTLREARVNWSSRDPEIVSVDVSGRAIALATTRDQSTTITARIGDVKDEIPVNVRAVPNARDAASLELRGPPASTILNWPSTTALYTAIARTASGQEITNAVPVWTSSQPSIVSITPSTTDSRSALATVLGVGEVTLTATVGSKSATSTVVGVIAPETQMLVWPDTSRIPIGLSRTLRAERRVAPHVSPNGASWQTSDATIASVDDQGRITATSEGHATITAILGERRVTAEVFVFRNLAPPRFTQIATGYGHACGLTEDGTAYCWGYNDRGQLGTDIVMDRCLYAIRCSEVPIALSTTLKFTSITAGGWSTCGLTAAGSAYCWGMAYTTGTGNDGVAPIPLPTRVALDRTFRAVSIGFAETCGIVTTGEAYCWGNNSDGQLGDGTMANLRPTPVLLGGGLLWREIRPGARSCGVTTDSLAYCWGSSSLTPVRVPTEIRFTTVSAASGSICGLAVSRDVYCWGLYSGGGSVPVLVPSTAKFVALENRYYPCAVTAEGETYCMDNAYPPQTTLTRSTPTFLVRHLTSGDIYFCALDLRSVAYCWTRYTDASGTFFTGLFAPVIPTAVPGQAP